MTDINEIVGENRINSCQVVGGYEDAQGCLEIDLNPCDPCKAYFAIQDVLAITKDDFRQAKWKAQDFTDGAESALDSVRQAITNRLGGME